MQFSNNQPARRFETATPCEIVTGGHEARSAFSLDDPVIHLL
jgi:hypothetical protein